MLYRHMEYLKVSKIIHMSKLFYNVRNMSYMFSSAINFNSDISKWNIKHTFEIFVILNKNKNLYLFEKKLYL